MADAVEKPETLEPHVRCGEAIFAGIDLALQALARRLRRRVGLMRGSHLAQPERLSRRAAEGRHERP